MKAGIILFLLIDSFSFFSQSDVVKTKKEVIKSIREISRKKGEISVESIYPVETSMLTSEVIWLDSNFKVSNNSQRQDLYVFDQIRACGFFKIYKLKRKQPVFHEIDSLFEIPKVYSLSKPRKKLAQGKLIYKHYNKLLDFVIENGKVVQVDLWSKYRKRLISTYTVKGLYENETWPVKIYYDRSGKVKHQTTYLFYMNNVYAIHWKF